MNLMLKKMPPAEEIKAFYDTVSAVDGYQERMYRHPHDFDRMARNKRLLSIALPFCSQVLEVGCADGMMSSWIAERVESLVGIDMARSCIERCRALNLPNADFFRVRLEDFLTDEYADDVGFDLVVLTDVLEHVPDPRGMMEALRGVTDFVLASSPINETPNPKVFDVKAYQNPWKIGDGSGHIWYYRADSFRALFSHIYHYESNDVTAFVFGRP